MQATRILVADDDPQVLHLFGTILRAEGYEVFQVDCGQAALDHAAEVRPNLVLSDVVLPDMSGIEVCRRLKANPHRQDVFVILISGQAFSAADKEAGLQAGADEYLAKPITPDELRMQVRAMARLQATTAALRASEQHYRGLIEMLPSGLALVGLDFRLHSVNPKALDMLGYDRAAELTGSTIFDLIMPQDADRARADIAATLAGQPARNVEYLLRQKNGALLPVEINASVSTDADGNPAGIVLVARDVSSRKRAEVRDAAFSTLDQQLGAAATSRAAAQIILNAADQLYCWDCCHIRLYDAVQDAIVPILAYDIVAGQRTEIPPAIFSTQPTAITRYVKTHGAQLVNRGDGSIAESLLIPFGDETRPSQSRMFVPIRQGDQFMGLVSIQSYSRPYTVEELRGLQVLADRCGAALERIRFAESLKDSEQRFRNLFEFAPIGIALHDAGGHFINVNRGYQEMLGYSEPELKQLGVKRITLADDVAEGQQLFEELRAGRIEFYHREKRYLHKDGRQVWAESSAAALRDTAGALRYIISMVEDITERKIADAEIRDLNEHLERRVAERTAQLAQANDALRRSEANLRLALDASNAATWSWDAVTNLATWDARYRDQYGFTPEEPMTLETWVAHIHPADRPKLLARLEYLSQSGSESNWNEEFRTLHPIRGERWMHGIGRMTRDAAGRLLGATGINLDITERKRLEQVLRESELKYRQLHESMTDAFASVDLAGQIKDANPAFQKLVGYSLVELQTMSYRDLTPKRWHASEAHTLDTQVLTRGYSEIYQKEYRRKDDTVFPVELRSFLVRDAEGKPAWMWALVRDITARKRIEKQVRELNAALERRVRERTAELEATNESLRESELRFRQLAENINEVFWLSDAGKTAMLYVSPMYQEIWGRSCESLQAKPDAWLESVHPDDRLRVSAAVHTKQVLGQYDEQFRIVRPDGTERWIRDRAFPIRTRSGRVVRIVGVAEDITHRRWAEEELVRLNRRIVEAQETERARVARELHDGVNQIIASARMRLNKVECDPTQLRPATRAILTRCNELLVQALEENRRIARNLHPIELDELGLAAAARKLCRDFGIRSNLAVKCQSADLKHRLPPAFELNLFRILQEALTNVEKHAKATAVNVRLGIRNQVITLTIKDNGRGFRPPTGRENHRKGAGVGLSNMRERANALGGQYDMRTAAQQGTTVTVRIPMPRGAESDRR